MFFMLVALLFLGSVGVVAQTGAGNESADNQAPEAQSSQQQTNDFSDKELKKFAQVMKNIQKIQKESNKEVESAFSESSLSKKRFNELYSARQQGGKKKADNETEAETKAFNKLSKKIRTIQQSNQKKMIAIVQEHDMTVKKFNTIVKALRSNPELSKRVRQFM
jgi:hypothetical protein